MILTLVCIAFLFENQTNWK